eukprot:COSAG01_NODE_50371_length_364_cov_0.490566_1_plen_49_part_01
MYTGTYYGIDNALSTSTCATLEIRDVLRSGIHGQIAKMTGTTHLTVLVQ